MNSQPSARAIGTRVPKPDDREPERLAGAIEPEMVRTWARAKSSAARITPSPDPDAAHPGRRGEGAEQDLLAERGDDGAGEQREGEPDRLVPVGGSGLSG